MKKYNREELYKPENYIKPGTKVILHMKDFSNTRFISGFNYLTLRYWEDYVADDDIELVFKEGVYCHLSYIESIEILED